MGNSTCGVGVRRILQLEDFFKGFTSETTAELESVEAYLSFLPFESEEEEEEEEEEEAGV